MSTVWIIYFAAMGLVFGSFYNVVGLRVPKHESIAYPGSHCPKCGHPLSWYENIPVFSFLFLKGRCRGCKAPISVIYPVFEAITGLLFAYAFYRFGWSMELLLACLFISLLVIITISDLAYMLIPDRVLLPFAIAIAAVRLFYPAMPWWSAWAGAILGFGLLYLIAAVTKGGMGGGDIKLYFVIGLALGVERTFLSFFLACLFGALYGIGVLAAGRFKKRSPIPFGPFIAAGSLIAYFFGHTLIGIYMQFSGLR
ncbi:prepilin peptidase [Heyndrickxia acidiproducens]|uniref:prepilin peptidase n=1 Tax=Heyndrickxia acidiproducens TaxID=1121084 RepID=UPI00037B551F|nr:A24 family peptidase [Heyndrickxia acidiproducens]